MKKPIALLLSIFTILLVSTSAFAFSGGGISGGVNGDGDFTGGGFSGGSRLSSVFGSSPPASSSLSTMLSYEALNNLTANINLGISLGEIEILDGNIQAVTVTKRTDWNAYVITGVYNGNTYVIVNASGGRYYSPINEGYTISAIAGASNYFLTNRPVGTTGSGYLGDLQVTYDNLATIRDYIDNAISGAWVYTVYHFINGEGRYYVYVDYITVEGKYYVCNSSGQLFYAVKDDGSSDDTGGGDSTFDPTEVITAINSVYDAINSQGSRLANGLSQLTITANTISDGLGIHISNALNGFNSINSQLSTLNSYFTDLSGLFPVQETITLLGSNTRVAWDSADRITNVTAAGFNGDLIVKERLGDLVDESGYEKVTINETEYSLYNDNNGYRRIKAANEYPDTGTPVPDGTLCYFPFDNSLDSIVGDGLSFVVNDGTASYGTGVNGEAFVFDGSSYLTAGNNSGLFDFPNSAFTYSFWLYVTDYEPAVIAHYDFDIGLNRGIRLTIDEGHFYLDSLYYGQSNRITSFSVLTPVNEWFNVALTYSSGQFYVFSNGVLGGTSSYNLGDSDTFERYFSVGDEVHLSSGSKIDELIFVSGQALWTSSFNAEKEAVFSEVAKDYFLPCNSQNITLNFYDSSGEQVTEYRWNQYTVNTSRLPNGYTELESIQSSGTQYINTLFPAKSTTRIYMDLDFNNSGSPFGCWDSDGNNMFIPLFGVGGQVFINYNTQQIRVTGSYSGRISIDFNRNVFSIDDTVLATFNQATFTSTNTLYLFAWNNGGNVANNASMTLYSCQIYDNGTLVRDFVPCINPSNAVGLYDLVNDQFYGNSGTGSFTAGAEVSNGSGIGQLVGVVSSTNRNAYPDDGEQNGFYYEYIGAFTEYPSFSQTLSPTDVNGNAITMGRLEDDFSEIYMDISTMMWYCHDPQTQTEILLSSANQEIMNDTIYVRQNYTMLPADQITADALQNLLPVDSPVYLDMPEGAKLTITYDHYTGWFRMMYILMDKQTKLLSDLDIVNETIINVENTVIDITNSNPAYNVFYITKTDGTTESVGDAAKDAAVFVGDVLSMFYRLVFDDALDNVGILNDFEGAYSNSEVSVW